MLRCAELGKLRKGANDRPQSQRLKHIPIWGLSCPKEVIPPGGSDPDISSNVPEATFSL